MHQNKVRGRPRTFYNSTRVNERVQPTTTRPSYMQLPTKKINRNISKHDNNCCREVGINLDLNEESSNFLRELKKMWNMLKKSPPVVSLMHLHYNNSENPYIEALKLIYNCQEFNNAKSKSLPMFIIEELKNWINLSRNKVEHLLTSELKIDAFKIVTKQNTVGLMKVVMDVFDTADEKEIFLQIIYCKLERKQYKDACQYTTLLKLHDRFTINDFLIPLVLQDKLQAVDDFLNGSASHQIDLVAFMDSILGQPSIREAITAHVLELDIPDIKVDKLHPKPWKKLITRYIKAFKLPSDLTPNLNKKRNEGALQFLLHKKFIENTLSDESWKEMVQEAIGDDEELQKELVCQVSFYGDSAEALRWAHFYNVEKEDWPYNVRMLHENPDGKRVNQVQSEDESWDDSTQSEPAEYHKFALPEDAIHLVDTENTFEAFLDAGLQDVDVVGIDCEWKPSFGGQKSELALMQIATRKNVFVLDIINLGNKVPHLWQELGKFLFNNCDILKLGFSFTSDISMIKTALPELIFTPKQVGFLDLCSLWKLLEKYPKVVLPHEVQSGGPSLTSLVHQCLGHPLDKSDQFSNWEKRPLRKSQLAYAALDAYCLIEVYDTLKRCCEEGDFPFEETCYNLMTNEKCPKKKHKKSCTKKVPQEQDMLQPPSPHANPISASDLKVVCDTSLQGLGKKLRRCGINTAILENNREHMECVRYAQDEHRYILTRGNTFNRLCGCVQSGHCLKIISDDVNEQLKQVLDYYKVIVSKDHVFSRCQGCNGNSFIKVSRSTMAALAKSAAHVHHPQPEDYYEDEATGFSSEEDYDDAAPPLPSSKKWDLCLDEKVDVGLCQTRMGASIQVSSVPYDKIISTDFFYVCEECGKVYWDGTHFERVLSGGLKGIVQ